MCKPVVLLCFIISHAYSNFLVAYSADTNPDTAYYGYVPSKAIGIVACALFGLSTGAPSPFILLHRSV